jgi:hypothetical protein
MLQDNDPMHAFAALAVATFEFSLAHLLSLAWPRSSVAEALHRTVTP